MRKQAETFSAEHQATIRDRPLRYITTFVGGGGPRFWFSASPQLQQLNYAQVLIEVTDKEITPQFISELQPVLTASIPGARLDARQLLTNPVDYPIEIRVSSTADVNARQEDDDIRNCGGSPARSKKSFARLHSPIAPEMSGVTITPWSN